MSRPARTLTAAAVLTLLAVAVLPGAPGTAQARSSSGTNSEPQQMPSSPLTDVSATALSYTGRYVAHLAIRRDQTSPRQKVRRTDMSNGSLLIDLGLNPVEVASRLGHSSAVLTLSTYAHLFKQEAASNTEAIAQRRAEARGETAKVTHLPRRRAVGKKPF